MVTHLATASLATNEIARWTGIPPATVSRWRSGQTPRFQRPEAATCPGCGHAAHDVIDEPGYAYLLGLYLGDGHLAAFPRTYCLRIYLDKRYPAIIRTCAESLQRVAPANRVTVIYARHCAVVTCYSKQWRCLLPQHGPGAKHERRISLEPWQSAITKRYARELIRGLIHSDGSRFTNPVRSRGRLYHYPRYFFSNRSEDIKAIFCHHLDLLEVEWRRAGAMNISIARRASVARLDEFVGPKR